MERRFTATSTQILTIIPVIGLIVWFMTRSAFCERYFPDMRTIEGEWNGANSLTMDTFSLMFLALIFLVKFADRSQLSTFFINIFIALSITDVVDRFVFHIRNKTDYELIAFLTTILVILIEYYYAQRKRKELV